MLNDFYKGLLSYKRAWRLISEMRLWDYLLLPGAVSLLLGLGIFSAAFSYADNMGGWLISIYPWEFMKDVFAKIASFLGALMLIPLGLMLYKYLVMIIVSPLMAPLSKKVEERITGLQTPNEGFITKDAVKSIFRGLHVSLRNVLKELGYTFALVIIGFIPVVGWVSPLLIFFVQAYYAGFGNMDYTLERYYSVEESVRFVKRHQGLTLANGTVFLLVLAIPLLGLMIAPALATISATLECVPRIDKIASSSNKKLESEFV